MSSVQQQNLINNMNIMGHPLGPHHQELPWYIVRDGMFMLARLDGLPVPGTRSPGTAAEHLPSDALVPSLQIRESLPSTIASFMPTK